MDQIEISDRAKHQKITQEIFSYVENASGVRLGSVHKLLLTMHITEQMRAAYARGVSDAQECAKLDASEREFPREIVARI